MKKIYPLLVLTAAFASGCSAIKHNVVVSEPADGQRARVRVVIPDGAYRGVRAYPDSTCTSVDVPGNGMVTSVQMFLGFEKNLNGKKIGVPPTSHSEGKWFMNAEIFAKADQPITFSFLRPSSQSISPMYNGMQYTTYYNDGCNMAASFTPEAGGDYELVFDDVPLCSVTAKKLTVKDGLTLATAVETRPATRCKR